MAKNLIKKYPFEKEEEGKKEPYKQELSDRAIAERGGIAWITDEGIRIFKDEIAAIGTITNSPQIPTKNAKDSGERIIILPGGEEWDITRQSLMSLCISNREVPKNLKEEWTIASELEQDIENDIQFMHNLLVGGLSQSFNIKIKRLLMEGIGYNNEPFYDMCYWTNFRVIDQSYPDSIRISGKRGEWYSEMFVLCNKDSNKMAFQVTAGSSHQPDKWLWGAGYLYQGIDRKDLVSFDFSQLGDRELELRYDNVRKA